MQKPWGGSKPGLRDSSFCCYHFKKSKILYWTETKLNSLLKVLRNTLEVGQEHTIINPADNLQILCNFSKEKAYPKEIKLPCRGPQSTMTTSLELLNPLYPYPAFNIKYYPLLLLFTFHFMPLCIDLVYTSALSDFIGAGPIFWECLNPTTGLCTWMAPISAWQWCHRNYHNEQQTCLWF